MEGEDLAVAVDTTSLLTATVPAPSSLPRDPDPDPSSPVGSPEIKDIVLEEEEYEVSLASNDQKPSQPAVLSDNLRDKIIKQVEYYFCDENLPNDKFLLKYVTNDKDGYVPVGVIASFRKMKRLTTDRSLIVAALKGSSSLVLSSNGKRVRRLQPLPVAGAAKDTKLCVVVVENLPEDHSVENIQRIFGEAGKIKNISINDPHDAKGSKKLTMAEKLLNSKLHALVEYETIEDAEKAVTLLNNEQDWRFGMRVKLVKRLDKHVQKKKVWRDADMESHANNNRTSDQLLQVVVHEDNHNSDHLDDTHEEEDQQEHSSKEKNNELKGPNRRRGRGQKYRGANGHGHGTVSSSSSNHGNEASKPPPGPKMPDGTRGFTMGRGRPLPLPLPQN